MDKKYKPSYGILVINKNHPQYRKIVSTNNEEIPKTENKSEDQMKLLQEILHKSQERKTTTSGNQKVKKFQYTTVPYMYCISQRDSKSRKVLLRLLHHRSQQPCLQEYLQSEVSLHQQLSPNTTLTYKGDKWSNIHKSSRNRHMEY